MKTGTHVWLVAVIILSVSVLRPQWVEYQVDADSDDTYRYHQRAPEEQRIPPQSRNIQARYPVVEGMRIFDSMTSRVHGSLSPQTFSHRTVGPKISHRVQTSTYSHADSASHRPTAPDEASRTCGIRSVHE
jgi:hypothetical protein